MLDFLQVKAELPDVSPDILFRVFGFPISNSGLEIFFILLLTIAFCYFVVRKFTLVPRSKFQVMVEGLYESMVKFIHQLTGSEQKARDILPIISALFTFVGVANLINLIPGLNSITWNGTPIFRTPTSDFNTTFSMAVAMIIFIQIMAMRKLGAFAYVGQFIRVKKLYQGFRQGIGAGFTALIEFFIGFLDIISELAKMFSLSLRLFGNIYAGEVLLTMLFGTLAIALPSLWMSLSIFFGVIQAIVFGALAAAYYGTSVPDDMELVEN